MKYPYYEVQVKCSDELPDGVKAFQKLDDAIEFANENEGIIISEIGGSWDDYLRCEFCNDWYPTCEFGTTGYCWRCELALHSRGEL